MSKLFLSLALGILAVAVIVLIVVVVRPVGEAFRLGVFGIVLGMVAIAVGVFGWYIAQKSEDKMQAIANLSFDEKAAMLERYEAELKVSFDTIEFEKFLWDMEALAHVAKWARQGKRTRVGRTLNGVAEALVSNDQVNKGSVERLRELSAAIGGKNKGK